jgi:SAM-dependent methyltransferase
MSSSVDRGFQQHEVEDYERRRYRGLDQRFVDRREQRVVRRLLRATPDGETCGGPALALDAPCGYGRFSALIQSVGFGLVSSDLSFHMVSRARVRDEERPPSPGVVADMKRGLPFKPSSFELVLSMRFFHHVHESRERVEILRELGRVSSRRVVLSYYELNRLHRLQRKIRRWLKKGKTRIMMVPKAKFRQELEDAGFRIVKKIPLLRGLHAQKIVLMEKAR